MRRFVLNTHSESGDDYTYFIEHPKEPTHKQLQEFLKVNASDTEEEDGVLIVFEHVRSCVEITEFQTIPTTKKKK